MNPIKVAYCRIFQTAFRIALPILPYRCPVLLDSIGQLPDLFRDKGICRVLMVTDPVIRSLGITTELEQQLQEANISLSVYDQTAANPTSAHVEAARQLYLQNDCQALIGFGGGSSIDCAKAVGARIAKPRQSLAKMKGILRIHKRIPLLIAIPTTAGTGSETTLAAVIVDEKNRHKYPINDFPLIPRYAVLDPEVTKSLPRQITATTGLDALTHAVEAYIGRSTTRQTRAMAMEAVQLIFFNLEQACNHGGDLNARRNMLHAAYQAGNAFTRSYVGYVHGVAHSLGGAYNIPHGLANAVLLPYVLEAYGTSAQKKLHDLAVAVGISTHQDSHQAGAKAFIQAIRDLEQKLNVPSKLKGIREADIPRLARYAEKESNPLYPVPKLMTAKELEQFYYDVMEDVQ